MNDVVERRKYGPSETDVDLLYDLMHITENRDAD